MLTCTVRTGICVLGENARLLTSLSLDGMTGITSAALSRPCCLQHLESLSLRYCTSIGASGLCFMILTLLHLAKQCLIFLSS